MKKIFGFVVSVALILLLLISSVEIAIYGDSTYFEKEYQKYGVYKTVNMTMDDLLIVTDEMMAYLKDKREDLDIMTTIGNEEREFFSEREKAHMEDVKGLFLQAIALRRFAFIIVLAGLIYAYFKKCLPLFCRCFLITAAGFLIITAAGAALVATNFNRYFTLFHQIFFNNDLWILNPEVDLLVNIVPLEFFMDTALRIVVLFGSLLGILCIISFVISKGKSALK